MYIINRNDYYKLCFCLGIMLCFLSSILVYLLIVVYDRPWDIYSFLSLFISISYTLFFLIKYLKKKSDYVALSIDEKAIFICSKKDEGVYIPWEKIKYVIFVIENYGSKIIVRQHNKETHELLLRDYFNCFRPRSAIKAAYKYADDKKKIKEVKDYLVSSYEDIMRNVSKTEIIHA